MPCPTGSFKIISRGKGQSCMASCAYYAGEKKYSEYECCWKYPHSSSSRVKWVEVMLPSNAPRAYADPQTLWNAVDAAETSVNAQTARSMLFALPRELTDEQNLALVRDFCQKEFVDKGSDDYPLNEVISAYLDMRKDGRETWNRYAQEKSAVHDLKDGFKAVSFLSNHELYTVGQLGQYIAETQRTFSKIKAESTAKERRIRDIDALFGAIQTIRELKPIQQEYESIHWNGKREKFKTEHGDELSRLQKAIWFREKLTKSLGLASPLDKEQRAALKTKRMQLEAEREAFLPKLEEVKAEMAELNRIRYWTRKVIPDALPRMSDGRVSVEDAMETAGNRKELEEIMEKTEQRVTRQQSEHEKNQKNQSPKDKLI